MRQPLADALAPVDADVEKVVVWTAQFLRRAGEVALAEGNVALGDLWIERRAVVRLHDAADELQRRVGRRAGDQREPAFQRAIFDPLHAVRDERRGPRLLGAEPAREPRELRPGLVAPA